MCLWLAETVLQLHYWTVPLLQEMSLSMNNAGSANVIAASRQESGEAKSASPS